MREILKKLQNASPLEDVPFILVPVATQMFGISSVSVLITMAARTKKEGKSLHVIVLFPYLPNLKKGFNFQIDFKS